MPTVFISYSHKDAVWKERRVTQLQVLEHVGILDVWDDQRIEAGQDWEHEIEAAMSDAAVTVLMISADFLTSKFIKTKEIPRLLQRREQEGMRVIPVIVRPCLWKSVPWLSAMQARPRDGRPLVQGNRARYEADLTAIVEEIAEIIQSATSASPPAPPLPSHVSRLHVSLPARPDTFTLTAPIRMEFVRVPAGPFLMGSDPTVDKDAQDDEQPQHTVEIGSDFYIGKYPVTNAQYAPFAKATGRKSPPAGRDDLPVVNVTWRDAVAFAEWLSQKTGQPFRLPVEPEWEKASRGEDGRLFPWDDDWDPKRANTWEDGPGQRTPVGAYSPDGDSPYGCADMAGNVWEWTGSLYRTYPYQQDDGREDPDSNGSPVVRGGSWENDRRSARCAYRGSRGPDDFLDVIGFRVVLSLPGLDAAPQSVVESAEPREPSHPAVFDLSVQAGASPLAADVARPSAAPGDATTKKPPKAVKKPTDHIRPDTFILTEPTRMEFVRVDGGSFLMGSDKTKYPDSRDDELPRRRIEVPEFFIGKYPVTNAQYASFAKATGRKAPLLGKEDHPVVNVGWRDAVAFTEWLSRQTGKPFRLPAEPEWEKAARGTDGRLWPWGNNWDPKRANTSEGGRGGTTPVGQYSPGGDSPYGCADMAGNVWEWTSSLSKPYPYDPGDGREDLQAGGPRVVRGGSWYDSQGLARAAYRLMYNPGDFDSSFGFRVALSLSS